MTRLTDEQRRLVESHLWLVRAACGRSMRRRLDYDDFFQAGVLGLIRAVQRYRPGPARFSSFAFTCVRDSMGSHLRDHVAAGFTGLNKYAPGYFDRAARLSALSLSDPGQADARETLASELPSRYDYDTWCVSDAPTAGAALEPVRGPGVRLKKGGYMALGSSQELGSQGGTVYLGLFSFSRYGGRDAACDAANRAAGAFRAFHRASQPGRDLAATLEHLWSEGYLPSRRVPKRRAA